MFTFEGVDDKNFNSDLRRALVYRIKARFEDPQVIADAYSDIATDGVFPKDPDLQYFLTSSAAVAAGLQLQHAFEMQHSKQECVDMIENYVMWGGDHGLTEDTMRIACKLPPRNRREATSKAAAVIQIDAEPDEAAETLKQWKVLHQGMMEFMLIKRKTYATPSLLSTMRMPRAGPNVAKEGMVQGLVDMNLLQSLPGSGKADVQYMPRVKNNIPLERIIRHQVRDCSVSLPEICNVGAFAEYMHKFRFRRENADLLAEVLRKGSAKSRKAGRINNEERKMKEDMQEKATKLQQAEAMADTLLEELDSEDGAKRRRTGEAEAVEVKQEVEALSNRMVSRMMSYHYPETYPTFRSRKQVNGIGAQKFSRRAQMVLYQATHDLDIENSIFTLILQLLERLEVDPQVPEEVMEVLQRCVKNRSHLCRESLRMSLAKGKQAIVAIFHGGQPANNIANLDVVHNLQKASIYCRWLAASLCPDDFRRLVADSGKKHPDASILSYLYMACEDFVLTHWTEYLMTLQPAHLSLHFDGVRVASVPGMSVEDMCRRSEQVIEEKTGFKVHIREKHHRTILSLLRQAATETCAPKFRSSDAWVQAGNCILHALAILRPDRLGEKLAVVQNLNLPENVYMQQRFGRTYEQCAKLWGCDLVPRLPRNQDDVEEQFLVHVENGSCPHCVAVERLKVDDTFQVTVWDVDGVRTFDDDSFWKCLHEGVDHSTCVLFCLGCSDTEKKDAEDLVELLALTAAGHDSVHDSDEEQESQRPDHPEDEVVLLLSGSDDDDDEKPGSIFKWLDESGKVSVEEALLRKLEAEVDGYIVAAKGNRSRTRQNVFPCPACPFRTFDRCNRLLQHLQKYHTRRVSSQCIFRKNGKPRYHAWRFLFSLAIPYKVRNSVALERSSCE